MKWRKIKSLDFKYEVNQLGEVRNIKSKKVLKQRIHKGYYSIGYNDKKRQHCVPKEVHRLVAECWIDNPDNKPCVNHKDGNGLNNNINNLEWCTYRENMLHSIHVLNNPKPPIKKHMKINISNEIKDFYSYKEVYIWLKENNYTKGKYKTVIDEVRKCIKGLRNNNAYGFKWFIK